MDSMIDFEAFMKKYEAYYATPQVVGDPIRNPDDARVTPTGMRKYAEIFTEALRRAAQ